MILYPLVDRHPWSKKIIDKKLIMAVKTGEFREPRKGDWYLSGAIAEGYRANHDLESKFHILQIVRSKKIEKIIIIEREKL